MLIKIERIEKYMAETINFGWLQDYDGNKFAPRSVSNKIYTPNGEILQDKLAGRNVAGESFDGVTAGVGAEIFNDLENNVAIGEYSHAQGSGSKAIGDYSFAADGGYASGMHTISLGGRAYGDYSTAISSAITLGDYSLSTGLLSMSKGIASISLGACSLAIGAGSMNLNNLALTSFNAIYLTYISDDLIYSYSENESFEKSFNNGPVFIVVMIGEIIIITEVKSIDTDNKTITLSSSIGTDISN